MSRDSSRGEVEDKAISNTMTAAMSGGDAMLMDEKRHGWQMNVHMKTVSIAESDSKVIRA